MNETLYPAVANRLHQAKLRPGSHDRIEGMERVDKIINIDQSPIGRTPRSNPATYTNVFDHIRQPSRPDAARADKPGRFSFNVKGGRCEVCRGDGQIKIEMHFRPTSTCPASSATASATTARRSRSGSRASRSPTCSRCRWPRRAPSSRTSRRSPAAWTPCTTSDSTTSGSASRRPSSPAGRRSGQARHRAQGRHRRHPLHPRRAHHRPPLR